jgi:hypothetical protein
MNTDEYGKINMDRILKTAVKIRENPFQKKRT